jgi:hypothetical protein
MVGKFMVKRATHLEAVTFVNRIGDAVFSNPVFFLHHCFIDKVWADWQAVQMTENPDAAPHYAPERNGPTGHNLGDQLKPSTRTVRDVLSISGLGYEYEPAHNQVTLETFARSAIRRRVRTPFWAD